MAVLSHPEDTDGHCTKRKIHTATLSLPFPRFWPRQPQQRKSHPIHEDQQEEEVHTRGGLEIQRVTEVMPGGVRLSGGPALSETEHSTWESEVSSVVSIGDRIVLSDTEDEYHDKNKYCLPDVGKTRLDLHTKEPLSPSPRPVIRSPRARSDKSGFTSAAVPDQRGSPLRQQSWSGSRWTSANAAENVGTQSESEFTDISRAGSIYSLSRVSFAGQLSQLTNIRLPDATSLAKRISSIPTSSEAARSLTDASEQIRLWIGKASEVLQGLNADDDVEWAAAGGREGIEEVDQAINRFEKLVDVYVLSIERLQTRHDVASLSASELTDSVKQMESIMTSWQETKNTLKNVKQQVQLAMEWEMLWNTVLGEIAQELDSLGRLVFEMEEKRHDGTATLFGSKESIDLHDLEVIVEENPARAYQHSQGFDASSTPPLLSPSITLRSSFIQETAQDDSSLLSLFAQLQPIRAQLDFLPMRLSTFGIRGRQSFPTACQELEDRRTQLEEKWRKLEADADGLRRELGEDKWVSVFKNAGRQAMKMSESISRSYNKLLEGLDAGEQASNIAAITKKAENYNAKKLHYSPAIERVLAIIDRGVAERLTVNGEILRLQADMKRKWSELQASMKEMDSVLAEVNLEARDRQLRDSVSTVMSSERSLGGSSYLETPVSSPASSVVGNSRKNSFQGSRTPTPMINTKSIPMLATPSTGRISNHYPSSNSLPRTSRLYNRSSVADFRSTPSPVPPTTQVQWPSRPPPRQDNRPKWNSSVKSDRRDFASLSTMEPSPYAKASGTPRARVGSSLKHATSSQRIVSEPTRAANRLSSSTSEWKSSLPLPTNVTPQRSSSALAYRAAGPSTTGRRSRLSTIPASTYDGNEADTESPSKRPPSALRSGRRSSMLPMRSRNEADEFTKSGAEKPAWRP